MLVSWLVVVLTTVILPVLSKLDLTSSKYSPSARVMLRRCGHRSLKKNSHEVKIQQGRFMPTSIGWWICCLIQNASSNHCPIGVPTCGVEGSFVRGRTSRCRRVSSCSFAGTIRSRNRKQKSWQEYLQSNLLWKELRSLAIHWTGSLRAN